MENTWKSDDFSWKSGHKTVEKIWNVEKKGQEQRKILAWIGFAVSMDKTEALQGKYGKNKEKIFSCVEKYVESVTKLVKSTFSALFRRKMMEFAACI